MMIKKFVLLLLFTCAGLSAFPQKKDFGIWYGINAEHKLAKKLELDLSTCLRTFKNASKSEEAYLEAGLTYKLFDFMSVEGSYRITENIEDDDAFHIRHKWFVGAKGSISAGDFDFSLRARFQERYKTYIEDEEDKIPDCHLRSRFKVLYDIPSFKVNPYISGEIFVPLFKESPESVDKKRFTAGAEYNFADKKSVELEYIFQRDYLPKLSDINIISLQFNIKF